MILFSIGASKFWNAKLLPDLNSGLGASLDQPEYGERHV